VLGAVLPHIRADLHLSYGQVGTLLATAAVVGNLIEVPVGVLADRGHRRRLVVGGGVAFTAALVAIAGAPTFALLLVAFLVYYPASGAFVGVSQAVLVDLEPQRGEALMARWTLAGSLGVVLGPLLHVAVAAAGASWRTSVALVAGCFAVGVAATARLPIPEAEAGEHGPPGWRDVLAAARRPPVRNALVLLHLSDLLGGMLSAFLALYLVDVAGWGPGAAASGLALWAGAGLVGDALAVPVLDRYEGRAVVRVSAVAAGALYTALLVVDGVSGKLVLLALLGLSTAGWYAVLQARLYSTMPGRSGVAISLGSASGILAGALPLAIGLLAERFGLASAMWVLLGGPLALAVGLRRGSSATRASGQNTSERSPA